MLCKMSQNQKSATQETLAVFVIKKQWFWLHNKFIWRKNKDVTKEVLFISLKQTSATFCYEHVWINQSSDLTLINLIKASHDAMPSLNLAHLYWTLRAILSTSFRCSALSSFIFFIILLGKHIWHITSHLYRA